MDSVAEGSTEGTVNQGAEVLSLGSAIRVDADQVWRHVGEVVRGTVEQTLNALLDAEADALCGAKRYERSPDRQDTRAGSYDRKLVTKAGEVTLKVPRLRKLPLETAIIERYRRRESSVEEALVEMYLGGRVDASGGGHHRGALGMKEDAESVRSFLRQLKQRGERRTPDRQRQVPGPGRGFGRVLSGGGVAAVRGALPSQRLQRGADWESP